MEALIERSLTRIRKASSRRDRRLREECDRVLAEIAEREKAGMGGKDVDADKYFEPFRLACAAKSAKIKESALDTLHKLIAYSYLRGRQVVDEATGRTLMDDVMETICSCKEHSDESVQLQVIKAVLNAVTTSTCEVHERSLLMGVQACYHIYLTSRNLVNRTTAKATLTQMVNIVFQRMETWEARRRAGRLPQDESHAAHARSPSAGSGSGAAQTGHHVPKRADEGGEEGDEDEAGEEEARSDADRARLAAAEKAIAVVVEGATDTSDAERAALEAEWREAAGEGGEEAAAEATEGGEGGDGDGDAGGDDKGNDAGEGEGEGKGKAEEQGEEASGTAGEAGAGAGGSQEDQSSVFPSQLHRDAYVLFRSLCRLATQPSAADEEDPDSPTDPVALQSKLLSLELLLSVLENSGSAFRTGPQFVFAIREHLCRTLPANMLNPVKTVVSMSLRVFLQLVASFKDHLKQQIEVVLSTVFLRILESQHSPYDHKLLVLEVFTQLARDSRTLVELFVNYDCDGDSVDLFQRVVAALSKGARGSTEAELHVAPRSEEEEDALRMMALNGLVAITRSMEHSAQGSDLTNAGAIDDAVEGRRSGADSTRDAAAEGEGEGEGKSGEDQDGHALPDAGVDPADIEASPEGGSSTTGGGGAGKNNEGNGSNSAAAGPSSEAGSAASGNTTPGDSLDQRRRRKQDLQAGVAKFNEKPSAGLRYMWERGVLGRSPEAVARFLHAWEEGLDKTLAGEFLGSTKEYNVQVLYSYVDQMDFGGMAFDEAIRAFLAGFRLPGEAQQVDRIMEKFAERYCATNAGDFESADHAFVLAFSIIMLNTDRHNPNIRADRKMTKEGFIRNCSGILDGRDFPREYLEAIFDRIDANPISLREDDEARAREGGQASSFFDSAARRRRQAFHKERQEILRATSTRMVPARVKGDDGIEGELLALPAELTPSAPFYAAGDTEAEEHLPLMFDAAWGPLYAAFTVVLEHSQDLQTVTLCLEGFVRAIRLSAVLRMNNEREAFVSALAKFTGLLDPGRSPATLMSKHVACARSLLEVATTVGNHLGESWSDVLQCVSQLARLQLFAVGAKGDDSFFPVDRRDLRAKGARGAFGGLFASGPSPEEQERMELERARDAAQDIVSRLDMTLLDRIFTDSVTLDMNAIQDFVESLCRVSLSELRSTPVRAEPAPRRPSTEGGDDARRLSTHTASAAESLGPGAAAAARAQPRVYCMQKVVEVADFNMGCRSRVVWSRIWQALSGYFTAVGCHQNRAVAMYAIDSLRQLSVKFLEKEELVGFNFQSVFLRPFQVIVAHSPFPDIRELVLRVVEHVVAARLNRVRSGWRSVFAVLGAAAADRTPDLVRIAFGVVEWLVRENFDHVAGSFVDLCRCLSAFTCAHPPDVALTAIALLCTCAHRLVEGRVPGSDEAGPAGGASRGEGKGAEGQGKKAEGEDEEEEEPEEEGEEEEEEEEEAAEAEGEAGPGAGAGAGAGADAAGEDGEGQDKAARAALSQAKLGSVWFTDSERHTRLWWPLLTALGSRVTDVREEVRRSALESLFAVLRSAGRRFRRPLWRLIFRGVLFPIFDDLSHVTASAAARLAQSRPRSRSRSASADTDRSGATAGSGSGGGSGRTPSEEHLWLRTTCMPAMGALVDLLSAHYKRLEFLLPDTLRLLHRCINQEIEGLARIGVTCLSTLIAKCGPRFSPRAWTITCDALARLFADTTPLALLEARAAMGLGEVDLAAMGVQLLHPPALPGEEPAAQSGGDGAEATPGAQGGEVVAASVEPGVLPFRPLPVVTKCVVQLEMIALVGDLVVSHAHSLGQRHCEALLAMLMASSQFASAFNSERHLRAALWEAGFMRSMRLNKLPNLLRQETSGLAQTLRILFALYDPELGASAPAAPKGGDGEQTAPGRARKSALGTPEPDEVPERLNREEFVEERLVSVCQDLLRHYAEQEHAVVDAEGVVHSESEDGREVQAFTPVVVQVLSGLLDITDAQFAKHVGWLYPVLVDLVQCESRELRVVLHDVLKRRVGPVVAPTRS